jgi:hypothetical protein
MLMGLRANLNLCPFPYPCISHKKLPKAIRGHSNKCPTLRTIERRDKEAMPAASVLPRPQPYTFFFFFVVLGLKFRAFTLSQSSPIFVKGFLR